jgi:hypothetical protein
MNCVSPCAPNSRSRPVPSHSKLKNASLDLFLQVGVQVIDRAIARCRESIGFVDRHQIVSADNTAGFHPRQYRIGNGGSVIVLIGDAKDRVVMPARKAGV